MPVQAFRRKAVVQAELSRLRQGVFSWFNFFSQGKRTSRQDRLLGDHAASLNGCIPDFLIVAAPKTGSTWVAHNLVCHPGVFLHPDKEIKYFSNFHEWLDLDWYLSRFRAGEGRVKGEASPSYALLPLEMIQQVHAYFPRLKLVFLLREPCSRAWSHARHCGRYGEANFLAAGENPKLEEVANEDWLASFCTDWVLASGDYLGQLRRWLAVFPRDQVFVGFYETIQQAPRTLLMEVCDFLELPQPDDWTKFRLTESINEGPRLPLPPVLRRPLRSLLYARTRELEIFLRERLGLTVPDPWQDTLAGERGVFEQADVRDLERRAQEVWDREFDDFYLAGVLAEDPLADVRVMHWSCQGYNIVHFRRCFYLIPHKLGSVDLRAMTDAERKQYQLEGPVRQRLTSLLKPPAGMAA
jgi:Sulfotransferase domain